MGFNTKDVRGRVVNARDSFCDDADFGVWGGLFRIIKIDRDTILIPDDVENIHELTTRSGLYGRRDEAYMTDHYIHWARLVDQPSDAMLKALAETRCWIAAKAVCSE